MVDTEPVHRALLAVDVESSGGRESQAFVVFRDVLFTALREAFEASLIGWAECVRADRGDGMTVVVPADVPKSRLIHPLLGELAARLRQHNRYAGEQTRIRLRVAIHAGEVLVDAHGVTGRPKVHLARLLEADALRAALATAPESATVALIVSETIYDNVVADGNLGIDPERYRRVTVSVKETTVPAWVHVPGHPAVAALPPGKDDEPGSETEGESGGNGPTGPAPVTPSGGINFINSEVTMRDAIAGDKIVGGQDRE